MLHLPWKANICALLQWPLYCTNTVGFPSILGSFHFLNSLLVRWHVRIMSFVSFLHFRFSRSDDCTRFVNWSCRVDQDLGYLASSNITPSPFYLLRKVTPLQCCLVRAMNHRGPHDLSVSKFPRWGQITISVAYGGSIWGDRGGTYNSVSKLKYTVLGIENRSLRASSSIT